MDAVDIGQALHAVLALEKTLLDTVAASGHLALPILAAIVFAECGLLPLAFLPGDSLIFAVGALVGAGALGHGETYLALFAAAVLGYFLNYWLGHRFGAAVAQRGKVLVIRDAHVREARVFCERWGWWAIVLARFVPFVRTFAPFVAGMAAMPLPGYLASTLAGAAVWLGLFIELGRIFGHQPFIREHLPSLMLATGVLWLLPPGMRWLWRRFRRPLPR